MDVYWSTYTRTRLITRSPTTVQMAVRAGSCCGCCSASSLTTPCVLCNQSPEVETTTIGVTFLAVSICLWRSQLTAQRPFCRKEVYREEASCAEAPPAEEAGPEHPQAEFKQDDADADMAADGDVGYSSDWDSDEDDDEDEDDEDDMLVNEDNSLDSNAPMYDALVALNSDSNTDTTTPRIPRTKPQLRLPLLSSVRVYVLEAVPEQTGRNGVPFMGRGTPVDRQRRADWAAPAQPCLPYSHLPLVQQQTQTQVWSPSPSSELYSPASQHSVGMETGYESAMQVDVQMPIPTPSPAFGMEMSMEHTYAQQAQQ